MMERDRVEVTNSSNELVTILGVGLAPGRKMEMVQSHYFAWRNRSRHNAETADQKLTLVFGNAWGGQSEPVAPEPPAPEEPAEDAFEDAAPAEDAQPEAGAEPVAEAQPEEPETGGQPDVGLEAVLKGLDMDDASLFVKGGEHPRVSAVASRLGRTPTLDEIRTAWASLNAE